MNSCKNKIKKNNNHNKTVKRDRNTYMGLDVDIFKVTREPELLKDASQNCNLFHQCNCERDTILISSIINANTNHIDDSESTLRVIGPQQFIGSQIIGETILKTNGPIYKNKPNIFDYSSIKLSKGVWFVESSILLSSFEPGSVLSLESLSLVSQTINEKNCTHTTVTFVNSNQYINKISGIFSLNCDSIIYVVISLYNLDGNIKVITLERNPNITATRIA